MEGTCLKRKEDWSMGALKPRRSQEYHRRKERSGRIPLQKKEEEDSPEKLGNKEEEKRRAKRLLKEV